jgi:hypothetical protein
VLVVWLERLEVNGVAVDVDPTRALRNPQEISGLVNAVVNARESDESDWIEWKRSLDLRRKDTQGTIARHILGMANRQPGHAARHTGGCGYIVVGAEPSNCAGVEETDPAVVGQGIQPFLGSDGPGWSMQYVQYNGMPVLVVIVEPPRFGDRIFTLQKEFAKYLAGTVFVRRQGRTVQAEPGDIRSLEDRFGAVIENAERTQRLRSLHEIGTLVERIIFQAQEPANNSAWWRDPRWRCEEQNLVDLHLITIGRTMPNCRALVGESGAKAVLSAGRDARDEIKRALEDLSGMNAGGEARPAAG